MKTYKQLAHERLQSRIRELRQTIDTALVLDSGVDVEDQMKLHRLLARLATGVQSRGDRKRLRREIFLLTK